MCGLFILMPIGTRTLDPKKPSWSKERIDSSMFAAAILATRQQKASKKPPAKVENLKLSFQFMRRIIKHVSMSNLNQKLV